MVEIITWIDLLLLVLCAIIVLIVFLIIFAITLWSIIGVRHTSIWF